MARRRRRSRARSPNAGKPTSLPQKEVEKVLRGKKTEAAVRRKAERVVEYWQSIAPVFGDLPPKRKHPPYGGSPGDYRDSIQILEEDNGRIRVAATDYKAAWIEFGSAHMPKYAPLAKVKARFKISGG